MDFQTAYLLLMLPTSGAVSASIAQVAANVTATGGTQTISTVNDVAVTQVAAALTVTGGVPTLAAMIDAAIAQQAASLTLAGGLQIISTSTGPLPSHKDKSLIFLTDGQAAVRIASGVYLPL